MHRLRVLSGVRTLLAALTLALAAPVIARASPLAQDVEGEISRIDDLLASMSTRERVAQLLLAYPQLDKTAPVEVGGVLLVGSIRDLDRARALVASSRSRARIPPFFAVDIEGGEFNRLDRYAPLSELPSARELAALPDGEVEAWGYQVGMAMRDIGLNMNLAPVLDVASSGHMFDDGRSFSGDPDVVVAKGRAYAAGLNRAGVIPIAKHFPGYGNLAGDSDHALVVADYSRELIQSYVDVFEAANGTMGGVMMANVGYTPYGGKPAVLTPELVALAQHHHGWLTITDDLAIGVLAQATDGDKEEVLRQAFLAGNDLLLTTAPPDWDDGIDYIGVLTAMVEADPSLRERLDASVRRVLQLKERMGLLEGVE